MANHYIQKYASAALFAGDSPEKPNAFPIGAIVDADGNVSISLGGTITLTGAALASAAVYNSTLSKLTLTPSTGSFTAANGVNAIRGEVNITTGITMTSGYVAGVYGRANVLGGTITATSFSAVYAKSDYNGATIGASAHVAPLMSNIVNPPSTGAQYVNGIYVESAGGTHINSFLQGFGAVNYAFDFSEVSPGTIVTATAGGSASKYIRISLNGTAYKIALLADA